ncbi:hypothetical protein CPB97_011196 [Podila verticillata]|nr:hypothetical protein CPB97_011196 [Podila verticillata]
MASPLSVATQPAFSPAQTLTEQEQKLQRMYGKLPQPKNLLGKLRSPDRKYFDSGDYALSKAGKINIPVGLKHPSPEAIPHMHHQATSGSISPIKESPLLHQTEFSVSRDQ